MKTRVEFDKDDYRFTHYMRPIICIIWGGIFLCLSVFDLFRWIADNDSGSEFFRPTTLVLFTVSIVCLFPYGLNMLFPLGRIVHKESKQNVVMVKTGTIDSIKQLYRTDGYKYQPGITKSKLFFWPKPFKPGKQLTSESIMQASEYNAIKALGGQYYGAYLVIGNEKFLVMSSTWFKEGDCVWIKYFPKSKIVLEMDYSNNENN